MAHLDDIDHVQKAAGCRLDCRGGKAGDACTTNRKKGERTEGLGALTKRRLNTPQKENIPQSADVEDSEDIVVER